MIPKLDLSCFYMYKAIPLAFNESMSYLEQLYAILKSLNETIDIVNKHSEFIESYESQYEYLQEQINEINIKLNSILSDIDTRFNEINRELNHTITELRRELNDLIISNYNTLKNYVDEKDEYLEDLIRNISIENIILRDPTTGLESNIQIVINNLFNVATPNGITAKGFDDYQGTAKSFDDREITAYTFDTSSKLIFV